MNLTNKILSILAAGFLALNIAATKPEPPTNKKYYKQVYSEPRKKTIDSIILHYTAGWSVNGSVQTFKNQLKKKIRYRHSYHYIIGRDGTIYPLVPDNRIAFHARGPQKNRYIYNSTSIGISLANYGWLRYNKGNVLNYYRKPYKGKYVKKKFKSKSYWEPITKPQLKSLYALCKDLVKRYKIPVDKKHIYGHTDVSTMRLDPGGLFPWKEFYKEIK